MRDVIDAELDLTEGTRDSHLQRDETATDELENTRRATLPEASICMSICMQASYLN
jgi:hypothetical protein